MKQRIITGLIALPILLGIIWLAPPTLFALFVSLSAWQGLRELYAMLLPDARILDRTVGAAAGGLLCLGLAVASSDTACLTLAFFAAVIWFLVRYDPIESVKDHLAAICFGWLYVPLLLSQLVDLRNLEHGRQWIFLVLAIVFASDTFAYFVGVTFGKHRLYPAISPKKSIEGSIGGLIGSLLAAWVCQATFMSSLSLVDVVFLGVGLGVIGPLGDLVESMIKRSADVKDSGTIFPGHGGILDRLDSLLFAFPLAALYARYLM